MPWKIVPERVPREQSFTVVMHVQGRALERIVIAKMNSSSVSPPINGGIATAKPIHTKDQVISGYVVCLQVARQLTAFSNLIFVFADLAAVKE